MAQNGVPLEVIKEVLGRSDISIALKYAHHKNEAKTETLNVLEQSQIRRNHKPRLVKSKGGERETR